jgi:hypothetical protein
MRSSERSALVALLTLACLASGCIAIERTYVGSAILADPEQTVVIGSSTKPQVLSTFGPPDRIVRQRDGDVFMYRHAQRNGFEFRIEEPVFTGLELFRWENVQEKSDRLLVFFDITGVVTAYGFRRGRDELEPF